MKASRISVRKVQALSESERQTLRGLTFNTYDSMMLEALLSPSPQTIAVIYYRYSKAIAWACIDNNHIYVYVKKQYRRKGIGKKVLAKAIDVFSWKRYNLKPKKIQVFKSSSRRFYEKSLGVTTWGRYERSTIPLTTARQLVNV